MRLGRSWVYAISLEDTAEEVGSRVAEGVFGLAQGVQEEDELVTAWIDAVAERPRPGDPVGEVPAKAARIVALAQPLAQPLSLVCWQLEPAQAQLEDDRSQPG